MWVVWVTLRLVRCGGLAEALLVQRGLSHCLGKGFGQFVRRLLSALP